MAECDICGREFDTERGMHIHRRQAHPDADDTSSDTTEEETTEHSASFGNLSFSLKVTHAIFAAFLIGIFAGGFFTATLYGAAGVTGMLADGPSDAGTGNDDPAPSDTGNQPSGDQIDPSQISMEGEPVLGDPNAPVTVVAYEDFECPFCQRFEQGAMAQIKSEYVESGQVKVVWKDFPLTQLHPWAKPAAIAMECVYRQDEAVFWTLNEKVFNQQNALSAGSAQDTITQWASQEGVSASAVQSCIDSGDATSEVDGDMSEGRTIGVSGTPTVFVEGRKIVGAQPFSAFRSVIESALG